MSQRTPAVEPPHGSPAPATFPPAWLGWAAAAVGAVAVLVAVRMRPPAPAGTDAPAAEFSAGRAAAMLLELCPDGAPHPVGSEAAAAVRARVAAAFEALGAAVEEQREFVCAADRPACGTVSNVLARLPGTAAGPAVLLAAHYDSVPAGPGISDDLAAVAVLLETARTLGAGPRPANAVIFLVDDGEEAGLLGARAFVARHRWARDVGVVVNQEARGTSGLSLMFETSDENAWLIDAYARAVRRPAALSLTAEVYRRLPNDTDLTVFKGAGMAGLNFAFIGDVSRYHTPLDDIAHLDRRTLQHQGESVLAVARALANADLAHHPRGRSSYQDLLGFVLLRWPVRAGLPLALAAAIFVAAVTVRWSLSRRAAPGAVLAGAACLVATIAAAAAAGYLVARVVRALGGAPGPWPAHPLALQAALWAATIAAGGSVAALAARRAGMLGMLAGTWLGWSAAAVAAAGLLPGTETVLLLPLLAAAGALAVTELVTAARRDLAVGVACVLIVAVTAAVWLPLGILFPAALGLGGGFTLTVPAALIVAAAAPLAALASRWRRAQAACLASSAVVAVAATLAAALEPPTSRGTPERLNVVYLDDYDAGACRWVAGSGDHPLAASLRRAAAFGAAPERVFPWSGQVQYAAPAPPLGQPAPELAQVEVRQGAGERSVAATLRSPRRARAVMLFIPRDAPVRSLTANGEPVVLDGARGAAAGAYRRVFFAAVDERGIRLELRVAGTRPLEVLVADIAPGLPAAGEALVTARPATAVPSDFGDATIVYRRAEL